MSRSSLEAFDRGRIQGEVSFFGEVDVLTANTRRVIARIASRFSSVDFCYEAGPKLATVFIVCFDRSATMLGHGAIGDPKEAGLRRLLPHRQRLGFVNRDANVFNGTYAVTLCTVRWKTQYEVLAPAMLRGALSHPCTQLPRPSRRVKPPKYILVDVV